MLSTLRFPLQTITNTPFFETPASLGVQEGQPSLFPTEKVSRIGINEIKCPRFNLAYPVPLSFSDSFLKTIMVVAFLMSLPLLALRAAGLVCLLLTPAELILLKTPYSTGGLTFF